MTNPVPAEVSVAGLRVPATLVPRIVRAFRRRYPDLTADKDDDTAVRAVLRFWVTDTLAWAEADAVMTEAEPAAQQLLQDYRAQAEKARQAALAAAGRITEAAPPPEDEAVP